MYLCLFKKKLRTPKNIPYRTILVFQTVGCRSIYSLHRSFNCYVNQNPGHKHNPLEIPEIQKEKNLISNEIGNGFRLHK